MPKYEGEDPMVVVEEEDDDEQPLATANTGSNSGHLGVPTHNQPQSVLIKSSNPLKSQGGNSKNEAGSINFDMQSSAFNTENEMA